MDEAKKIKAKQFVRINTGDYRLEIQYPCQHNANAQKCTYNLNLICRPKLETEGTASRNNPPFLPEECVSEHIVVIEEPGLGARTLAFTITGAEFVA